MYPSRRWFVLVLETCEMLQNKTFNSQNPIVFFDLFQKKKWSTWWLHFHRVVHTLSTCSRQSYLNQTSQDTFRRWILYASLWNPNIPNQCQSSMPLICSRKKNKSFSVHPRFISPWSNHDTKLVLKPVLAGPNTHIHRNSLQVGHLACIWLVRPLRWDL